MSVTQEELVAKLAVLEPTHVAVTDTSTCGQAYDVVIVSNAFAGKPLLARHRLVNDILKDEIAKLHAFSQKTYTPEQWAQMQSQ